jgi:hypothetical protein
MDGIPLVIGIPIAAAISEKNTLGIDEPTVVSIWG